jgi:hypothetical protein
MFYAIIPIVSVTFLTFAAYIEVDFVGYFLIYMGIDEDKENLKNFTCSLEYYKIISFMTFMSLGLMYMNEKIVFLLRPKGSRLFKLLILMQIWIIMMMIQITYISNN